MLLIPIVGSGAADLIDPVLGEPRRAGDHRLGQPVVAQRRVSAQTASGRCLSCVKSSSRGHNTLTGRFELLGDLRRLAGHGGAAAAVAAKAAAQKQRMGVYVLRIPPGLVGNQKDGDRLVLGGDQTSTLSSWTWTVALIGSMRAWVSNGRW